MANYGLNTYDSGGRQMASTVLSPLSVGFYAGDYTTTNSKIPTAADGAAIDNSSLIWNRRASTANAAGASSMAIHGSTSSYHEHSPKSIEVYGDVSGASFQYTQPTVQIISEGFLLASTPLQDSDFNITKKRVDVRCMGFRNKKTVNNYGAYILNQNYNNTNSALIDEKYKQMYVQPSAATGALVQYANAAIYPRVPGGSYSWGTGRDFGGEIEGNVIFPRPYDKPPLIFIQNSADYISLYSMNKDANGKYVSATIVGYYEVRNTANASDDYAWPRQSPFSYFLVTEDEPTYALKPTDNVGMQVFDAAGEKLFDSRYQSAPISMYRYYKGAAGFTPASNLSGGQNLLNPVYSEAVVPKGQAFCINTLSAVDGLCTVVCFVNTVEPYYKTGYGLVYGRFIKIEDMTLETKVTISTQCTGCSSGFLNGSTYHVAFNGTNTTREILTTRLETEKYTSPIKEFRSDIGQVVKPRIDAALFKNPIRTFSSTARTGKVSPAINAAMFYNPDRNFIPQPITEVVSAATELNTVSKNFFASTTNLVQFDERLLTGSSKIRSFISYLATAHHEKIEFSASMRRYVPIQDFSSSTLLSGTNVPMMTPLIDGSIEQYTTIKEFEGSHWFAIQVACRALLSKLT